MLRTSDFSQIAWFHRGLHKIRKKIYFKNKKPVFVLKKVLQMCSSFRVSADAELIPWRNLNCGKQDLLSFRISATCNLIE